jgi:catechol 2,3-dioxygenase-like lactoylglutathione lyase family enzyme
MRVDTLAIVLADFAFVAFVPVRDPSASRSFYEETLGLSFVESTPAAVVLDAGGTLLRLTPVGEFTPQPFTIAGWQVPDITESVRVLTGRGVGFRRYDGMDQDELGIWTTPGGDRVAWFGDPDGNTLSLTSLVAGT